MYYNTLYVFNANYLIYIATYIDNTSKAKLHRQNNLAAGKGRQCGQEVFKYEHNY